jgi:peptide/nickel transport system ATP-binding protein
MERHLTATTPLLSVRNLSKHFEVPGSRGRVVKALSDISFDLGRGEVIGLVGESGSGKTTIGRSVLRLVEPTKGEVFFDGEDLLKLNRTEMRPLRRRMQYVFQSPFSSLSPRMTIGQIMTEGLKLQKIGTREERLKIAAEAIEAVELSRDIMDRYAHEFSGGQRQRIGIARALTLKPDLIVADEPVSALDVSVQAQVVNLLRNLQVKLGISIIFITHDLGVIEYLCDRVVVLYLGRIMEIAPSDRLHAHSRHPYTRALLSAIPSLDPDAQGRRQILKGEIPSPLAPPSGCVFRTRCPLAVAKCAESVPPLIEREPGHSSACWRDDEIARGS